MAPVESREGNPDTAVVLLDGKPTRILKRELHALLGVQTHIRIPKRYSRKLEGKSPNDIITHFGMETDDTAGTLAALTIIETPGWYIKDVEEVKPVLSIQGIWIAEITLVITCRSFDELTEDLFINPIGPFTSKAGLREELLMTYRQSMPGLEDEQILGNISVRQVRLDHMT